MQKTKRSVGKVIKIVAIVLVCLLILPIIFVAVGKLVNFFKSNITSDNGIREKKFIQLGGIEQYIYTRGQDKNNPVIIFLHGGPGSSMAFTSYFWQTKIEQQYTIINWDQRGSGNTYYRNPTAPKPTIDRLLSDLDELVDYALKEFGQQKVIIMGHSFGTILGAKYAAANPQKVAQYVGIGQAVSLTEGDIIAMEKAIVEAQKQGNTADVAMLEKGIENEKTFGEASSFVDIFQTFMTCRQLISKYLPTGDIMTGTGQIFMGLMSPDMTIAELKWFFSTDALLQSNSEVFVETLAFNQEHLPTTFEMPVTFITGEYDHTTPATLVERYVGSITAPNKQVIIIENTGHSPMMDDPEAFQNALLTALK
jgi:pimeloyl-ACP methyl ester carboxylesterase